MVEIALTWVLIPADTYKILTTHGQYCKFVGSKYISNDMKKLLIFIHIHNFRLPILKYFLTCSKLKPNNNEGQQPLH